MSNIDIISILWKLTKSYGEKVRTNNLDGLQKWNELKTILKKYDESIEWRQDITAMRNEMMESFNIEDNEKDQLPEDQHEKWAVTHFFFQHGRIPFNNKESPTFLRLMQIAYNSGQLRAVKNNEYNTKKRRKYYKEKKLGSYKTYISSRVADQVKEKLDGTKIIMEISDALNNLDKELKGGNKHIMNIENIEYKIKKYIAKLNYYKNLSTNQ
jgi:hypothetical protein